MFMSTMTIKWNTFLSIFYHAYIASYSKHCALVMCVIINDNTLIE
jgi:hypothetical protein